LLRRRLARASLLGNTLSPTTAQPLRHSHTQGIARGSGSREQAARPTRQALYWKMQRKRAPPWPHGVAQGRSPNVWCNMDPRYAGKCNAGRCNGNAGAGGTHNSPSAAPLVLAPRMVHRLLRASRGLRARACCYKEATRILKEGGTKRTRRATGIGIARAL
jgi:hypothetical protein